MSKSPILTAGQGEGGPKMKKAFEINDFFKLAFLAGATTGIDFYRNGVPLRTLAAMEEFGSVAFQHMFSGDVVDPADALKAMGFFDHLWKSTFEAK